MTDSKDSRLPDTIVLSSPVELKEWPKEWGEKLVPSLDGEGMEPFLDCDPYSIKFTDGTKLHFISYTTGYASPFYSFWDGSNVLNRLTATLNLPQGKIINQYCGDLDEDGFNDIALQIETKEADKTNLKSFILYWKPFFTYYKGQKSPLPLKYEKLLETLYGSWGEKIDIDHHTDVVFEPLVKIANSIEGAGLSDEKKNHLITSVHEYIKYVLHGEITGEHDLALALNYFSANLEGLLKHEPTREWLSSLHGIPAIFSQYKKIDTLADMFDKDKSKVKVSTQDVLEKLYLLTKNVSDGHNLKRCLQILHYIRWAKNITPGLYHSLVKALIELGSKMTTAQLSITLAELRNKFDEIFNTDGAGIINRLAEIVSKNPPEEYFTELHSWLNSGSGVDPKLLGRYDFILKDDYPPPYKDLEYGDRIIGVNGVKLLYKKFNITHFARYSGSVLIHLAQMAANAGHKKNKPLVLALVAKSDKTGMFYWGSNFYYDPNVRLVTIEYASVPELVHRMWWARKQYGIPDTIFMTAHGTVDTMTLGDMGMTDSVLDTYYEPMLKKGLKGIYGVAKPQVVLNSCETGGIADKAPSHIFKTGEDRNFKPAINIAQMWANVLNTDVYAPEAIEGLLKLWVEIDELAGKVKLRPFFVEVGKGTTLGISFSAGKHFVPDDTNRWHFSW